MLHAMKQAQDRIRRGKQTAGIVRPVRAPDPSPPCTENCEENAEPHRHCEACDRTWAEGAFGAGPLAVSVTSTHESGGGRRVLMS